MYSRRVRASEGCVEDTGAVARAVVGHDALDRGDAARREPGAYPVEERDCGIGFLVLKCFGICEAGVVIDREVQVDVAGP